MLNKISLIFKCGLRRAFKRHLLGMNTIIILFIIDFFLIEGDLDISRILTGVVREKKRLCGDKISFAPNWPPKTLSFSFIFLSLRVPEWVNQN